jgi:putative hydrolase of the HAD superfamily
MTEPIDQDAQVLAHVDSWVFDLDNTLYPAHCNLFLQVDKRMGAFIAELLDLTLIEARRLQKHYYRVHGTTLNGLMREHGLKPQEFLDYVHDIDLSVIPPDTALDDALGRLDGPKYVFTNGSREHALNVMERVGISHHFTAIFDIEAAGYIPKPSDQAYRAFLETTGIDPTTACMFEDLPRNLEIPHALGMTTVLIEHADHPDGNHAATPPDKDFIHHVTTDLSGFLAQAVIAA